MKKIKCIENSIDYLNYVKRNIEFKKIQNRRNKLEKKINSMNPDSEFYDTYVNIYKDFFSIAEVSKKEKIKKI